MIPKSKAFKIGIERAHKVDRRKKLGTATKPDQPWTIVCRLKSWKQNEAALRKASKEKAVGLFICKDLAPATLDKRATQVERLKEAKKA